jgi:hypothetical protein
MCLYTRTPARLHVPRTSLLSDVLFLERFARQDPSLHCSSPATLVSQPQAQKPFPCAFDSRISRRPVSSFLPNYYSETPALSRHWLAVVRKHSLLMMTGAALVGRRWADRQCRDRTVSFSLLFPLSNTHEIITCAKD